MKNYLDRLSIGKKQTGGGGSKSLTLILFLLLGLFGMSQNARADLADNTYVYICTDNCGNFQKDNGKPVPNMEKTNGGWYGAADICSSVSNVENNVWVYKLTNGSAKSMQISRRSTSCSDYKGWSNTLSSLSAGKNYFTMTENNWSWTVSANDPKYFCMAAGHTVYFDNSTTNWSTPYIRYGRDTHSDSPAMTKVAGTKNLWSWTSGAYNHYKAYTIADKYGWTGSNSVYCTENMSNRIVYYTETLSGDVTIVAGSKGGSAGTPSVNWYNATKTSGQKTYTVSWSTSNGSLTVKKYTGESSTTAISSGVAVLPTQYITIEANPSTGYKLDGSIQVTGATYDSSKGAYYVTGTCTISATFTAQQYTIIYKETDGSTFAGWGSTVHPTTHTYNTATTLVNAPNKTGYTFGGWCTDQACTNVVSSLGATDYTADITLYAKWTANPYTITLNKNNSDASGSENGAGTVTYDNTSATITTAATRKGYNVEGYYTAASSGTKVLNADGSFAGISISGYITDGKWSKADNCTLYAHWTGKQSTITINKNDGSSPATTRQITATYGQVPPTWEQDTRTGHVVNYYSNSNGTGSTTSIVAKVQDDGNAKFTHTSWGGSGTWNKEGTAYTIYAIWVPAYTITLNANGADAGYEGTPSIIGANATNNPTAKLTAQTITLPTRVGYAFNGYWTDPNEGKGINLYTKNGYWNSPEGWISDSKYWIKGSSETLYAHWTATNRTITFGVGTDYTTMGTLAAKKTDDQSPITSGSSIPANTSITFTATPYTGYEIVGWYSDATCETPIAGPGTSSSYVLVLSKDESVYVKFQEKTFAVTTVAGTGISSVTEGGTWGQVTGHAIEATVKPGYTWSTWTITSGAGSFEGGSATTQSNKFYPTEASTVTASATANTNTPYTVNHYQQNLDGSYPSTPSETENLQGTTDTKVTPTRKAYTGFTAPAGQEITILGTETVVVDYQYTRNSHQLTWNVNGEGGTLSGTYTSGTVYYDADITAPTASRPGYTFAGWKLNNEGEIVSPATKMPDNDLSYYAQWNEIMHPVSVNSGMHQDTVAGIATPGTATAAPAADGYHFVEWTIPDDNFYLVGGCSTESQTITFTATADNLSVTANYELTNYTVTMNAGVGGTISQPIHVDAGSQADFTTAHYKKPFKIQADTAVGYRFVSWTSSKTEGVDDITLGAQPASNASAPIRKSGDGDISIGDNPQQVDSGYAQLNVLHNASLTATFEIITYSIKYHTNEGTPVADGEYNVKTETFNLPTTTKTGFAFAGWYDNAELEGYPVTQITVGSTGNKEFWAKWDSTHVYLEGRARVKNAEGVETTINPDAEWVQTLKTIPFTFNSTDGVYYLNTYCTVLEQAANVGTGSNYIRMGIANGDGAVTPYGCNTAEDYKFTPDAKGSVVGATNGGTNNKSFKFRDVETYENDNFKRRYPVMYRYNPTSNMFDYCAPLLTLTYSGATATMTGYTIAKANANAVADGLADDANKSIVYQYKQGDGDWQTWSSDITTEAGTYKLRAIASGNNEFGQAVTGVVSNEITVTVTTPAVTAKVSHVNGTATQNPIVRINDRFTVTPTITGVPSGDSVQVCYKWITVPEGSAIDKSKNLFNQVDATSAAWTTIDVAGDYVIRVSVSSTDICGASPIIWDSVYLPVHVKGDEITVYARLDKGITDWTYKCVYHWKDGQAVPYAWPGQLMNYIGKDSADYEWYSKSITNYKTYAGGKLLFNDSTKQYGQFQTNNVDMPTDDEFYFIKTAITGSKRDVATDTHINTDTRVILTTDTTALYQYVTIALEGKGVFFANREEMKYKYTITGKPAGSGATLNAKNQFTPDKAGNYTITIRCDAGSLNAETTFVLRVQENPLTLTANVGPTATINGTTTLTVTSTKVLSGKKTYTVIEPGTNNPITFQNKVDEATSTSYTFLSSGMYIFGVVLTDNEGKLTGKAQDTVTVAAKKYYIRHPFVEKSGTIESGDWKWKEMTYNAIDGTYQYKGDDAYFHTEKKANVDNTGTETDPQKMTEYTIVNPDNLDNNTKCIFVYDVTTDKVTVYALNKRLYRIKSICQDNEYFSNAVTYDDGDPALTQQVSFFAQKDGALNWQTRETAAHDWVDGTAITTTASASGIYTANPTKLQTEFALTAYTDSLFVFSQAVTVNSSEHSPTALKGQLTQFTKKSESEYYNHYWVRYVESNTQAMATMGNRINNCIAATLPYYQMPASGNVRYAYDNTTNHFSRTFLAGSGDQNFLRVYGVKLDTVIPNTLPAQYLPIDALNNSKKFDDGSDWIYTAKASGNVNKDTSVTAILATKYNNMNRWVLAESGLEADPAAEQVVLSKDAATAGRYDLTLIYDYKTNRLTAGAQPEPGIVIQDTMVIDQLILTREGDSSATQFTLAEKAKLIVVDKMTVEFDVTKDMWTAWEDEGKGGTGYKIMYFWFSVPYECRINEIYGLGVYGEKFEIQRYRGDLRASGEAGSATGKSAWRKLKNTATMEANRGYVIAMRVKDTDFKSATVGGVKKSVIRLFFPSKSKVELTHEVKTVLAQYVDSAKTSPLHWNWNIMGNPLVKSDKELIAEFTGIKGQAELNFIYEWTWGGGARTYEPWSVNEITLKSTHSYMVQGHGDVYWSYPSASAPARYLEAAHYASEGSYGTLNLRLNIKQDDQLLDKTYIMYREDGSREEYEMGRDLEKIINSGVTQMYAVTDNNLAAICVNSEDQEMIPLTVIANNNGTYSISLHRQLNSDLEPTIYDAETGEYTNLSIDNYSIDLNKGKYEDRFFFLLKKPGVITNLGELNSNNYQNGVEKFIQKGHLFIYRDGKIYNATGSVVE